MAPLRCACACAHAPLPRGLRCLVVTCLAVTWALLMAVAVAVLCMSVREVVVEGGLSSPEPCTLRSVQVRTVLCPVNYLFYMQRFLLEAEVQLAGNEATVTARPFRLTCPSALPGEAAAEAAAEALRTRNASAAGLQCYVFDGKPD